MYSFLYTKEEITLIAFRKSKGKQSGTLFIYGHHSTKFRSYYSVPTVCILVSIPNGIQLTGEVETLAWSILGAGTILVSLRNSNPPKLPNFSCFRHFARRF